jgi:hypothetical protein
MNKELQENCVALWFEYGYDWSDWTCLTANSGPHPFRPICQKDKPSTGGTGKRDVNRQTIKKKPAANEIRDRFYESRSAVIYG